MVDENQDPDYSYKEQIYYPQVILDNIKDFYRYIAQPSSDERDDKLISEINKMTYQVQIFEDPENIEKEFSDVKKFLNGKKVISYKHFEELLHLIAVACQRIWHRKGLLLTPVPYKEDIYKDLLTDAQKSFPDRFPDLKPKTD